MKFTHFENMSVKI